MRAMLEKALFSFAIIAVVFGTVAGAMLITRRGDLPASTGHAPESLSVTNIDFGSVPRGSLQSGSVTVHNNTADDVTILAVKPGCGCTSVAHLADNVIHGGESIHMNITLDTSQLTGRVEQHASIVYRLSSSPTTETCLLSVAAMIEE